MIRKTIKGGDFKSQMVGELVFDQVPEEGSFNPVTSDAVAKATSGGSGGTPVKDLIPDDASEDNKLMTEEGDQMKVSASAFNELNARVAALEAALANGNIGSVIADSIDTQTLLVGGSDLEARVAAIEAILTNNNLRTAAAPAPSFTKSVPVDNIDLQVEVDKTEETKKEIENKIMEEK